MDYLRYSWDFNEHAAGMTFINAFNEGIIVDGIPDTVDSSIHIDSAGVFVWHALTGDEGTILLCANFKETGWDSAAVYYDDNSDPEREPPDAHIFSAYHPDYEDTGDGISFGDSGVIFKNSIRDSITLELNFDAYFLPVRNMPAEFARRFARQAANPVAASSKLQVFSSTSVQETDAGVLKEPYLEQIYPNPFNHSAHVVFNLPRAENVRVDIVDTRGRIVRRLYSGTADPGRNVVTWDGLKDTGFPSASGLYFVRMETEGFLVSQKILLVK
jgi:hypothetical protein